MGVCCVGMCVAHTFASASAPNTPGSSVRACRPQLEPMALARVVMMLRVVVIWKGDGESTRNQLEQGIHTYVHICRPKSTQHCHLQPLLQLPHRSIDTHQVLVRVPQPPFECSREVSQGWLNELCSSQYLRHLLQGLSPHLPVLVSQVAHQRRSYLGTGEGVREGGGDGRV